VKNGFWPTFIFFGVKPMVTYCTQIKQFDNSLVFIVDCNSFVVWVVSVLFVISPFSVLVWINASIVD